MKKSISIILLICFICLSFTGCFFSTSESQREIEIRESVNTINADLTKKLRDPSNLAAINDYLISWAAMQNIPVSYDSYQNIIMSKKATLGHENDESTILHCQIGISDIRNYEAIASTLFILQNLKEHGFIRAIFTADSDENYHGSSNISQNYIKADKVISLIQDSKTTYALDSAAMQTYSFSKAFTRTSTVGGKAYQISIGPFASDSCGKIYGKHPNPIKELGDFFAYAKSKGIALELVDFSGGTSMDTYPAYAKATFVISDSDDKKFKKYFEKSASKFLSSYSNLWDSDPFSYICSAVSVPELAISRDESTQIFSLLYTMINGSFEKDENDITVSNTTLTQISTENDTLILNVCARAKNDSDFEQIASTLQIIAGLNDAEFNKLTSFPLWSANVESPIYAQYQKIFTSVTKKDASTKSSLQTSPIAIFKEKNPNMDALCLSINFSNNVIELEILEKLLSDNSSGKLPI
ncbi:MAG: hypothetical protein ACTTH0_03350 [Eubacteriales bacterium]